MARLLRPGVVLSALTTQLGLRLGAALYYGQPHASGRVTFHDYDFDLTPNVEVKYAKATKATDGKVWAKPGDMSPGQIVDVHVVTPVNPAAKKNEPVAPSDLMVNRVVIHNEPEAQALPKK